MIDITPSNHHFIPIESEPNSLGYYAMVAKGLLMLLIAVPTGCEDDSTERGQNHIVHIQNSTLSTITVHYSQEHYDERPLLDHLVENISPGQTTGISVYFVTVPTEIHVTWSTIKRTFYVDINETLTITEDAFKDASDFSVLSQPFPPFLRVAPKILHEQFLQIPRRRFLPFFIRNIQPI